MGFLHRGAWRSLVVRLLWEQEVAGSNPAAPMMRKPEGNRDSRPSLGRLARTRTGDAPCGSRLSGRRGERAPPRAERAPNRAERPCEAIAVARHRVAPRGSRARLVAFFFGPGPRPRSEDSHARAPLGGPPQRGESLRRPARSRRGERSFSFTESMRCRARSRSALDRRRSRLTASRSTRRTVGVDRASTAREEPARSTGQRHADSGRGRLRDRRPRREGVDRAAGRGIALRRASRVSRASCSATSPSPGRRRSASSYRRLRGLQGPVPQVAPMRSRGDPLVVGARPAARGAMQSPGRPVAPSRRRCTSSRTSTRWSPRCPVRTCTATSSSTAPF